MNRRHFLGLAAAAWPAWAIARENGSRLTVGVIGHTGRGNYGHGIDTMWLTLPETEIVAIADPDPKGLAEAQERLKCSQGFSDYHRLLAEVKPEIVAIGPRSADQHRDMVLAAAEAGVRGIYIEKPFARTPAEADEMVKVCTDHGVKCGVAHRNRWHPALPVIQSFVKDGGIGKLLEIRTRGKEDDRGGAVDLWILGSHALNIAVVFTGRPTACSATLLTDGHPSIPTESRDGDDAVGKVVGNEAHVRYETESGVPIFFDSIRKAGVPAAGFGLQLIGTEGIVDIRVDQPAFAHFCKGNPFRPNHEPRTWTPISTAGVGQTEPIADLREQIASHAIPGRDLIAAMAEPDRQPLCSAEDGRVTVEMITGALASHARNGVRVALPRDRRDNPLETW